MTRDEWNITALLIEHGWKGEWDDAKADAYFHFLKGYEADAVSAGLDRLVQKGLAWMPAAAEIVAAIRDVAVPPTPSWSEAWQGIKRCMTRATRTQPRRAGIAAGMAWAEEHLHPIVAAFIESESLDRLLVTEFYDPEYGPLRLRELAGRWEAFAGVAAQRLERGLALDSGARRQLGPAALDGVLRQLSSGS